MDPQPVSQQRLCAEVTMPRVCLRQMMRLSALFFHTMTWLCSASIDPAPRIDGQQTLSVTVQENVTHHFNCRSEGWDAQALPLLTWYLNGEQQSEVTGSRGAGRLVMTSAQDSRKHKYGSERNSTFTLKPKRWDRELVCAA
ncbi:transmembrane protein 25-like [Sinocyclocheilus rhinocerous]|uniref:transmembrane protein 25-like n=1 Tax=Sinocyclocheilus rhinocerous TaxID=307959 RepID=UPI0007B81851|nr:PREDICTED: transmembrane protein 25-like [Sinocyclocheilus rhinocerous]